MITAHDVERFRGLVTKRFGFELDDTKLASLAEVLSRRCTATKKTPDAYLERLDNSEFQALAIELTVPETYFFRHLDQFHAFMEVALPERAKERNPVRILSAGCASGEEPYTLAMLLSQHAPSIDVAITAIDVSLSHLERARRGRYSKWSLRETPDWARRFFRTDGESFELAPEIRSAVTFEQKNLIEPDTWAPGMFDIVFWRNVMMYFTPDHARRAAARISRAIVPRGYLFMGHAETLRGVSDDFHLCHTHGTFYYRRRLESERVAAPTTPVSIDHDDISWVDAIRRASHRIQELEKRGPDARGEEEERAPEEPVKIASALELLEKERFGDALAELGESSRDPQVLLLRSVLLVQAGRLADAETACHELLGVDEMHAGAHYLLALCREGVGDLRGAADHDQVAVYLDPGFAMPRLHLGLLARRADDREAARRELGQALVLLRAEDPSRLLLFGGGFGRETLVTLCRTELVACGGTP